MVKNAVGRLFEKLAIKTQTAMMQRLSEAVNNYCHTVAGVIPDLDVISAG